MEWEEKHQAPVAAGRSKGQVGNPPTVLLRQLHYPAALKLCETHERGKVDNVADRLAH
jgi:hypothetical protein